MEAERAFRAMGTDVHVVVHGQPELVDLAQQLIEDLEARWSRFIPSSEISELNRRSGEVVSVSPETVVLVQRAIEGYRLTEGRFDPTVLGDVVRAGYDRSFDELPTGDRVAPASELHQGADAIEVDADAGTVRLPTGVGFDPGGVGKGLAADLVAERINDEGAAGILVNIGGDLRAIGFGPAGDDWVVAIDPAASGTPVATVVVHEGALATSTTLRRTWEVHGERRHHLIDPATGAPTAGAVTSASVLAARGWQAEILAKAILIAGADDGLALVAAIGADALVVDEHGTVRTTPEFARFLVTQEVQLP